jgi:hypothetical protein
VPLFVEELAGALALQGRLHVNEAGIELAPGADFPIPDTLRDAVLLRLDGLPNPALRLLDLAAVIGREFDLALGADLMGGMDGFDALLERGLLVEIERGRVAFRPIATLCRLRSKARMCETARSRPKKYAGSRIGSR